MKKHAFAVDVADFNFDAFAQAQTARVNGGQADAMVESLNLGEDLADLLGGEHHREFELRVGADQFDLGRPGLAERFFPEDFDGADGLSGSLAGDFLVNLEVEEVLAQFFGGDPLRGLAVELREFADAGPVTQDGALSDGKQAQVVEETV